MAQKLHAIEQTQLRSPNLISTRVAAFLACFLSFFFSFFLSFFRRFLSPLDDDDEEDDESSSLRVMSPTTPPCKPEAASRWPSSPRPLRFLFRAFSRSLAAEAAYSRSAFSSKSPRSFFALAICGATSASYMRSSVPDACAPASACSRAADRPWSCFGWRRHWPFRHCWQVGTSMRWFAPAPVEYFASNAPHCDIAACRGNRVDGDDQAASLSSGHHAASPRVCVQ